MKDTGRINVGWSNLTLDKIMERRRQRKYAESQPEEILEPAQELPPPDIKNQALVNKTNTSSET